MCFSLEKYDKIPSGFNKCNRGPEVVLVGRPPSSLTHCKVKRASREWGVEGEEGENQGHGQILLLCPGVEDELFKNKI